MDEANFGCKILHTARCMSELIRRLTIIGFPFYVAGAGSTGAGRLFLLRTSFNPHYVRTRRRDREEVAGAAALVDSASHATYGFEPCTSVTAIISGTS